MLGLLTRQGHLRCQPGCWERRGPLTGVCTPASSPGSSSLFLSLLEWQENHGAGGMFFPPLWFTPYLPGFSLDGPAKFLEIPKVISLFSTCRLQTKDKAGCQTLARRGLLKVCWKLKGKAKQPSRRKDMLNNISKLYRHANALLKYSLPKHFYLPT